MEKKGRLKRRVEVFCNEARKEGLSFDIVRQVLVDEKYADGQCLNEHGYRKEGLGKVPRVCCGNAKLFILYVLVLAVLLSTVVKNKKYPECIVNNNDYIREMVRPVVNCDFCRNVRSVPIEENIERERFINDYAFTAVPVLIKGATKNWIATSEFNYHLIKDLFFKTGGPTEFVGCDFMPYVSEYKRLEDVFKNMPDSMVEGKGEPWYIGWHNCWPEMRQELGKYYQRPTFLPEGYTTSPSDHMFMGVAGKGAGLHLDLVGRPTWQAQITGKKTWSLIPPTECLSVCYSMNVTVEKGDIIVLDSNIWFHSTLVHPGELSIAIGTEFG